MIKGSVCASSCKSVVPPLERLRWRKNHKLEGRPGWIAGLCLPPPLKNNDNDDDSDDADHKDDDDSDDDDDSAFSRPINDTSFPCLTSSMVESYET